MTKKLLRLASLLLALILIFSGCSLLEEEDTVPPSEESAAFGSFKHYFAKLNEDEKRAYNDARARVRARRKRAKVLLQLRIFHDERRI